VRRTRALLSTVLVGFAAAGLVLPLAGCEGCAIDCDAQLPLSRTVDATVVSIDNGVVRLDPADDDGVDHRGDEFDVQVYGRSSALDIGTTYRVPIYERPADEISLDVLGIDRPTANLPSNCDCGAPFITHVDGAEVDTSILPSFPLRKTGWALLSGAAIAVLSWACLRLLTGEPL
jgi:hypothetical protein